MRALAISVDLLGSFTKARFAGLVDGNVGLLALCLSYTALTCGIACHFRMICIMYKLGLTLLLCTQTNFFRT